MISDSTSAITQYAGGLVGALFAFIFLLQKFFNGWNADKAENSVINLMHTELERMSEQNTKLSEELGKLQVEIIELNKELRSLTAENQRLHSEVALLTMEVTRLQAILTGAQHDSTSKD